MPTRDLANIGIVAEAGYRVLSFWSDKPDLWFRHVEEQFAVNIIAD